MYTECFFLFFEFSMNSQFFKLIIVTLIMHMLISFFFFIEFILSEEPTFNFNQCKFEISGKLLQLTPATINENDHYCFISKRFDVSFESDPNKRTNNKDSIFFIHVKSEHYLYLKKLLLLALDHFTNA